MHRRPLGMGRLMAAGGAILILVASFLAWYTAGGDAGGLSPISCNAFDGRCGTAGGMIDFIIALLILGLVALPYAIGDRPVAVDRGLSFGLLTAPRLAGPALRPLLVPDPGRPDRPAARSGAGCLAGRSSA